MFALYENVKLFIPFNTSKNNAQKFQLLCILVNTWYGVFLILAYLVGE